MSTLLCARAASAHSPLRFSEKPPPVRGELACGSSCAPVSRCRKRSRSSGANPPAAVRVPRSPVQKKEPPVRGEHADAVCMPRKLGAEKRSPPCSEPQRERINSILTFCGIRPRHLLDPLPAVQADSRPGMSLIQLIPFQQEEHGNRRALPPERRHRGERHDDAATC